MDCLLTHGFFLCDDPKELQIMKPYAPLGILYLASHLRARNFNVEVFDTTFSSWPEGAVANIALNTVEVEELSREIEGLIGECQEEIKSDFIHENAEKLRRIVSHFRAHLGQIPPVAPRCNAPWVSAVIESDGAVRPCFFHRRFGSMQSGTLVDVLNSEAAVQFRSQLDISKDPTCQRCVCSLFLEKGDAGLARLGERKARLHFQSEAY
jgi:hypothetical protein